MIFIGESSVLLGRVLRLEIGLRPAAAKPPIFLISPGVGVIFACGKPKNLVLQEVFLSSLTEFIMHITAFYCKIRTGISVR